MGKIEYINNVEILPIKNIGGVSIRAWYNTKKTMITYQFRVLRNGKSFCTSWKTPKLGVRAIKEKLNQIANELLEKAITDSKNARDALEVDANITYAEYVRRYISIKESEGIKESTLKGYDSIIKRTNEYIGQIPIKDITPVKLNDFYLKLRTERKKSPETVTLSIDLKSIIKPYYISMEAIAKEAGISISSIRKLFSGKSIRRTNAEKALNAINALMHDNDVITYANGIRSRMRNPLPPLSISPKNIMFYDIFADSITETSLSDKTIVEYHRFIHAVLQQAWREGLIMINPAEKAQKPKAKKPKHLFYETQEIIELLNLIDAGCENGKISYKWRAIIYIMSYTGCRRGEVAGLRWAKIDFQKNEIVIDNNLLYSKRKGVYSTTPKSDESIRTLSLDSEVKAAIEDYYKNEYVPMREKAKENWVETGYVFCQANGKPIHPDTISAYIKKLVQRYNLKPIHPHALRHSIATNLIHDHVDIVKVSRQLGHKDPTVTLSIYAQAYKDSNRETGNNISTMYNRNRSPKDEQ